VFDVIDLAQRTNTVSSLTPDDFSRSLDYRQAENHALVSGITGAMAAGSTAGRDEINLQLLALLNRNAEVTDRLNNRRDEPFVTQNTVTGKYGIKEAIDRYEQIQRNKNR
jgi:hypothetical protein